MFNIHDKDIKIYKKQHTKYAIKKKYKSCPCATLHNIIIEVPSNFQDHFMKHILFPLFQKHYMIGWLSYGKIVMASQVILA